jgi:hypothetical protein
MPAELLLLRIPISVGERLLQASTDDGSAPLTSSARGPQRIAFVRSVNYHPEGFELEVYPVVSFSHKGGGAIDGYNAADDSIKPTLIPLPPLSRRFPTPKLFGPPLVIGGWEDSKDTWLHVVPKKFIMPRSRSVSVIRVLCVMVTPSSSLLDVVQKIQSPRCDELPGNGPNRQV